jgi:hypothetical protein
MAKKVGPRPTGKLSATLFFGSSMNPNQKPEICKRSDQAQAWIARAADLAAWAMRRLVNRTDCWGGYWRDHNAEGSPTRQTTRPHPRDRGKVYLTESILARHFAATDAQSIVCLHTTSSDNTSRWGALDIDHHGDSNSPAEVNLTAAHHWHARLIAMGFRPLLTESNGRGGYHLRVLFREPVATTKVFAFLHCLVRDHAALGMATPPEVFPKQARVEPGGFGNWLRLHGRHHSREHWSRVWNGSEWLEGHAAIDTLLSCEGDAAACIPDVALAPEVTVTIRGLAPRRIVYSGSDRLAARIRAYLAKLPAGLGEGQHRDDFGFTFAAFLVRDLQLSDADALQWLEEWDQRNAVPKGADRLQEIIQSAHTYGKRPYGSGLRDGHGSHHVRHIRVEMEF